MKKQTQKAPAGGVKLSACVMVKDGGELFRNMLWSIHQVVDEIVVVNTDQRPSTSDTVAAEFFGARVIHSPWRKDFSHHRNESIRAASGDWLLIIDHDEELTGAGDLRAWLAGQPEDITAVQAVCHDVREGRVVMRFPSARLFRANCVRYAGRVHNQPKLSRGMIIGHPHLVVRHYGYGLGPEAMAAKIARSRELLEAQLADGDLQAHFYLAQQYGMAGQAEKCLEHCRAYLAARDRVQGRFNPSVFYAAAATCLKLGKNDEAAEWIKRGLAEMPDDPDLAAAMSDLGQALENWALMERGAKLYLVNREKALADPPKHFTYTLNPANLGLCLYRLAMLQAFGARQTWARFLEVSPDLPPDMKSLADEGRSRLAALGMAGLAGLGQGQKAERLAA